MALLRLHSNNTTSNITFDTGQSLLQVLQKQGATIFAPCGGNGACGKCKVRIKEIGDVNSCTYYPAADIEVILPNKRESIILTEQYKHTLNLPLKTIELAKQVTHPLGLAIDIGTTSIVFYWLDLLTGSLINSVGRSNPQMKYGADVISRISHCQGEREVAEMQSLIVNLINEEIDHFTKRESFTPDNIVKISVSANTTMLHLLLGINPTSIALVPFKPQFTESKIQKAVNLGLKTHPLAFLHTLPSLSAYVGADIIAGLASLNPSDKIKNYLFIDIGTNGEMAIVTPDKIFCCATAAGPAFEGANISCGMGAFDGAISAYNVDGLKTIADEKPVGICGSGLIDIMAFLLENNIVVSDGTLKHDFLLVDKKQSGNGEDIKITQQDIREIQLAKSAVITGINILLKSADITTNNIDAVYLAGGFGNFMNPENAIKIGLLPRGLKNKIIPVGNTSGAGAMLHLLNDDFIKNINHILLKSGIIELSNHPDFELEFVMNMFF